MRIRVSGGGVRGCGVALLSGLLVIGGAAAASGQTTITLNIPGSQAWHATVRGGSYADTNITDVLETRSSDTADYLRRALLKFDTENTIPQGASITSAVLTLTVKQASEATSRRLGAYQVTTSWEQADVTWKLRKGSSYWGTAGGDLGTKLDEQSVSNVAGSKVSFNVTSLVKSAISGALGSRYTRIAIIDLEGATSTSWRGFYTTEEPTSSLRPTLKVTYGGSTPVVTPPPVPTSTSGKVLRVLHWNIAKNGWGSDGKYDPNRVANWVVKQNPDVISFNEIEKGNAYSQMQDGIAVYQSLLESKTGVKWYTWDIQDYGVWTDKGLRSVVFSKFPFSATYRTSYSSGTLHTGGGATISYNGRTINFMTTHLDPYSAGSRAAQAKELVSYMKGFAENRIVCGDFNEQSSNAPITTVTAGYHDSWADAKKAGIAYSASDNPDGNTRNSRIDYIFYSRNSSNLTLKKITVVDTRDANGVTPSDHKPVLAEFLVQ
jgi:endonuclease/exonuclease/phosphatase family metal-dependent hydrolase